MMARYKEVGSYEEKEPVSYNSGFVGSKPVTMNDAAIARAGAFLVSELEKLNTKISVPLKKITYPRDIPVKVGGGWVDTISKMDVDYGISGGSGEGAVSSSNANTMSIIQAQFGKDFWRTHQYKSALSIKFVDMQRGQLIGRNLESLLTDGLRLHYDKHMEINVYRGFEPFGTTGLINNPNVTATGVKATASGKTKFKDKTPNEILDDINSAISDGWEAAEHDNSAIPNHIIMPYEQFEYIQTQRVSEFSDTTIMDFLMKNNVAKLNGGELIIGGTNFCKGAGAGGTDRMVCYVNNDKFIQVEELVPLSRIMTQQNIMNLSYDSAYAANISEVELFYTQPITYWDGI